MPTESERPANGPRQFSFNPLAFIGYCGVLIFIACFATFWLARATAVRLTRHTSDAALTNGILRQSLGKDPGKPWGDFICREITLSMPDEFAAFEAMSDSTLPADAWVFEGLDSIGTSNLMYSCGLSAKQCEGALSARVAAEPRNTVVAPGRDLVLALSPEVRERLYGELARFRGNTFMNSPFHFPHHSFDACLEKSELPADLVKNVRRMVYTRGASQLFSDYPTALRLCSSTSERRQLALALTRQVAVLPGLRIHNDSNIPQLLGYWGRGGNTNSLRPLFESLRQTPGGSGLSVLYLLPPFARERLYTFPTPQAGEPTMDCHWSSLNFFSDKPDPRFGDPALALTQFQTGYDIVPVASQLGDVIVFVDDASQAIHSCVHIADDVVFTKNGNNPRMPWKLMHLADVKEVYARNEHEPRLLVYRKKAL